MFLNSGPLKMGKLTMQTPRPSVSQERKLAAFHTTLRDLGERVFKSPVVPVEDGDGAYQTEDGSFVFTPCLDSPVLKSPTIADPAKSPIPGLYKWSVEAAYTHPSGHRDDPPYTDSCEICPRQDSLTDAISAASAELIKRSAKDIMEACYFQNERVLESRFPKEYALPGRFAKDAHEDGKSILL